MEKKNLLRDLFKDFKVTEANVDFRKRVIKLKYIKSAKEAPFKWSESVCKKIDKVPSLLSWRVLDIGAMAVDMKPQIEKRFADRQLTCDLSQDRCKILLTCPPENADSVFQEVEALATALKPLEALNNEFVTEKGKIKVSVIRMDIREVPADCFVSAVDGRLSMSGGVSALIANAAGESLREACLSARFSSARAAGDGSTCCMRTGPSGLKVERKARRRAANSC